MSSPAGANSCHWLLEPHIAMAEAIGGLRVGEVAAGVTAVPVASEHLEHFIAFENQHNARQVGPALREHLERFGPYFALLALADQQPVGSIRSRLFHEGDPTMATVVIAHYCVDPAWQGKGIGSDLVRCLSKQLLACPAIQTVVAEVDTTNLASQRVFHKNGFIEMVSQTGRLMFSRRKEQQGARDIAAG